MDSVADNAPSIIEAAAQSTLGILALLVLTVGVIAYLFFRNSGDRVKVGVFSMIFVGAAGFGLAVVGAASPNPAEGQPAPPETGGTISGGGVVNEEAEANLDRPLDPVDVQLPDTPEEPSSERAEISLAYLGDLYGCALQLQVQIGDRTFQPENAVYRIDDVPTGRQPYEISGVISCGVAGACEASGAGTLDVEPNAGYNVVWHSTEYATCDVVLQRGS